MKAILWDLGNVLVSFDSRNAVLEKIAKHFGCDHLPPLFGDQGEAAFEKLDTGELSHVDLWKAVCKAGSINPRKMTLSMFSALYVTHLRPHEDNIKLFQSLQSRFAMFVVSNGDFGSEFVYRMLSNDYGLHFRHAYISHHCQVKKPGLLKVVAENNLRTFGIRPEECVYVDDIADYIEAGSSLVFNTVHYDARHHSSNVLLEKIRMFL